MNGHLLRPVTERISVFTDIIHTKLMNEKVWAYVFIVISEVETSIKRI